MRDLLKWKKFNESSLTFSNWKFSFNKGEEIFIKWFIFNNRKFYSFGKYKQTDKCKEDYCEKLNNKHFIKTFRLKKKSFEHLRNHKLYAGI